MEKYLDFIRLFLKKSSYLLWVYAFQALFQVFCVDGEFEVFGWLSWLENPNTSSYDGGLLMKSDCGRIGVLALTILKSTGGADGG